MIGLLAEVQVHWEGWNLPGTTILFVLVGVVAGLHFLDSSRSRRPTRAGSFILAPALEPATAAAADGKATPSGAVFAQVTPEPQQREKRRSLRRSGAVVPVRVRSGNHPPIDGLVLNRSRGGLLIRLRTPHETGAFIAVMPPDGLEDMAWVQLEVRHCRKAKDETWLVACAFREQLPWSVLLLFG